MKKLTAARLRQLLHYDPETGIFTCLVPRTFLKVGDVAGTLDKSTGYIKIMVDGTTYRAHRLAWFYVYGKWPRRLDHEDTDKANNRIKNLRPATRSQNGANQSLSPRNSSGYKGVSFHKQMNKWRADIRKDRLLIYLGCFDTREAAHAAYTAAAHEHYGEFARP